MNASFCKFDVRFKKALRMSTSYMRGPRARTCRDGVARPVCSARICCAAGMPRVFGFHPHQAGMKRVSRLEFFYSTGKQLPANGGGGAGVRTIAFDARVAQHAGGPAGVRRQPDFAGDQLASGRGQRRPIPCGAMPNRRLRITMVAGSAAVARFASVFLH